MDNQPPKPKVGVGVMSLKFLPQTKFGKWSLVFIILFPVLMILGTVFANTLYSGVAGETFTEDIGLRPLFVLATIAGLASGVLAFVMGLIAIKKQKERAVLIFVSTVIGFLLTLLILAEFTFME